MICFANQLTGFYMRATLAFNGLNEKHIAKNKWFWKTLKPFLSKKEKFFEGIKLAKEDDTLIKNEVEVAMGLNNFF